MIFINLKEAIHLMIRYILNNYLKIGLNLQLSAQVAVGKNDLLSKFFYNESKKSVLYDRILSAYRAS